MCTDVSAFFSGISISSENILIESTENRQKQKFFLLARGGDNQHWRLYTGSGNEGETDTISSSGF